MYQILGNGNKIIGMKIAALLKIRREPPGSNLEHISNNFVQCASHSIVAVRSVRTGPRWDSLETLIFFSSFNQWIVMMSHGPALTLSDPKTPDLATGKMLAATRSGNAQIISRLLDR